MNAMATDPAGRAIKASSQEIVANFARSRTRIASAIRQRPGQGRGAAWVVPALPKEPAN